MNWTLKAYFFSIVRTQSVLAFAFYCSVFGAFANNINYRVQHYTAEEGLSQNYVDCIYKDSRDFLWIGTWYGLNRFDGYNFVTYRPQPEKNSISDGFINAIAEDKNGNLWMATRYGINKFVFKTEQFIHFKKDTSHLETSIAEDWITTLLFDNNNNLWIGTLNSGIEKITFNNDLTKIVSIQRFNVNFLDTKSITSPKIYSLLKDHNGYIYIGSLLGLDRLDTKTGIVSKFQDLLNPFYFEATVVHSLYEDKDHLLWIGTENGVLNIDYAKNKLTRYPVDRLSPAGTNKRATSNGVIKTICEDPKGKILVGTLGGLFILDKATNEFELFPENKEKEYSLNNKFINCIINDKNGNIWVGTDKGGVNKYNVFQKQFYYFAHEPANANSLNNNIINSVNEDNDYIWIGTAGGGLNRYNKKLKKFSGYTHIPKDPTSVNGDYISAIALKNNEMWLGAWGRGLCKLTSLNNADKLTFQTYRYKPNETEGPPFVYISGIIYDNYNNLWIGRPEGLEIYDKKNNEFYVLQAGSAFGNQVTSVGCLYLDSRNYLWIGTPLGLRMIKLKNGLSPKELSQPDSIFSFEHNPNDRNSICGNYIISILEDKTGSMWFSVYGHGICKLEKFNNHSLKAEFSFYTINEGLSNNVVYGMLEDNAYNLWLSSDRGLTKYNYKTKKAYTFYKSDGIQSNQFYWSAFYKNKEGIMYFGGIEGLNYFNPDSIKLNNILPRVVITDFKLSNQSQLVSQNGQSILSASISETSEILLSYTENNVSFEFSALSYESPEKNLYKYKLDGFDKEWTYTNASRRYVSYTNLNPGIYYFRVMGTNNDGVWNTVPTVIKLIITPPWWKSIWFKALLTLMILGLFGIVYIIRVNSLNKKRNELEKLVLDRTFELIEQSEKLSRQTQELNETNENLRKNNETKDKLLTIIAHDLKNPFNAILGMLELLMQNYDHYNDTRRKHMLSIAHRASKNLFKLLENLLQWARAKTGNIDFNPQSFIIKEILLDNLRLIENQAKEKNIILNCNCTENTVVFADINLVNTVMRNLLNNAVKFTQDGAITVVAEKPENENLLYVRIVDTGVGIEEQKLKDIFTMSNVNSTLGTSGETGTGLGLLICQEFVVKNGGAIWVESEKGKGSCFSFSLPLADTN